MKKINVSCVGSEATTDHIYYGYIARDENNRLFAFSIDECEVEVDERWLTYHHLCIGENIDWIGSEELGYNEPIPTGKEATIRFGIQVLGARKSGKQFDIPVLDNFFPKDSSLDMMESVLPLELFATIKSTYEAERLKAAHMTNTRKCAGTL